MDAAKKLTTPVLTLFIFFTFLFIYTKLAGPIPFSVNSIVTNKSDYFSVTGEGKVFAKPDVAMINVGVSANGATIKEAQDNLNSRINKVSDVVKGLGVDSADVKTQNYNINPNYDNLRQQPVIQSTEMMIKPEEEKADKRITSYSANSNLSIKVKNIDKANDILDAATNAGANQVGGISFDVSDKQKYENEAREKAVAEAKSKAESAAKIAGFSLGKIINYSEGFGGGPIAYALNAAETDTKSVPTQVEPGTNEIVVNVTLSYEVR